MTDPVYLKLKEDAGVVLKDLWRMLCPAKKPVRLDELRPVTVAQRRHSKPGARR